MLMQKKNIEERREEIKKRKLKLGILSGQELYNYRKNLQITQSRLAQYIGITTETLSKYERDLEVPSLSLDTLIKEFFNNQGIRSCSTTMQKIKESELFINFQYLVIKILEEIHEISPLFLNKIVFWIEKEYYIKYKERLSNITYLSYTYGISPQCYDFIWESMISDNVLKNGNSKYSLISSNNGKIIEINPISKNKINEILKIFFQYYASLGKSTYICLNNVLKNAHKDLTYLKLKHNEEVFFDNL